MLIIARHVVIDARAPFEMPARAQHFASAATPCRRAAIAIFLLIFHSPAATTRHATP